MCTVGQDICCWTWRTEQSSSEQLGLMHSAVCLQLLRNPLIISGCPKVLWNSSQSLPRTVQPPPTTAEGWMTACRVFVLCDPSVLTVLVNLPLSVCEQRSGRGSAYHLCPASKGPITSTLLMSWSVLTLIYDLHFMLSPSAGHTG